MHIKVQAIAPLHQVTKQGGVTSSDTLSGNTIVMNSEQVLTPELVSQARNAKLDGSGNFGSDLSQHSQFVDLSQVKFRLETTRTATTEGALGLNSGAQSRGTGSNFTFQLDRDNTFSIMLDLVNLSDLDISTVNGASNAVSTVEAAMISGSKTQTKIGSAIANLKRQVYVLEAHVEAVDGFRSRLEDIDFIEETHNLAKLQILIETSTSDWHMLN